MGWIDIVPSKAKACSSIRTNVRSEVWQGPVPVDDTGAKFDFVMTTVNGNHHVAFRSPNLKPGTSSLQLMGMSQERSCHCISTTRKMEYDIHAYVQTRVDLTYRLAGWNKSTRTARTFGHGGTAGTGGDDDGDDNNDGQGGGGSLAKRRKRSTKKTGSRKGVRRLDSNTGGGQVTSV